MAAGLRKSLQARSASDPDFWSVVGETELDQYEALADSSDLTTEQRAARQWDDLPGRLRTPTLKGFQDINRRIVAALKAQKVPAGCRRQAPLPLQPPALPQVVMPWTGQSPCTSWVSTVT